MASDETDDYQFYFRYDQNGSPIGFRYVTNSGAAEYYYLKNLQGDITGILNASGTRIATYTYNAWGEVLSATGTNSANTTIATNNPLRYRGYVYDSETKLYYLQSRYYSPDIGRFISADGYVSTGNGILGFNMFVYCNNNPVMYVDFGGTDIASAIKQGWDNLLSYVDNFINQISNAYTTFVSLCDSTLQAVSDYAIHGIQSAKRPPNIGKGTFAKNQANAIYDVNYFKNSGSKFLNKLAYVGVLIDAGYSTFENLLNDASFEKIVWDVTVDVALTGGNIWVSAKAGGVIGTFIGGPVGAVAGGVAGLATSGFIYWGTDYRKKNGLSLREYLKGVIS